jgi:hypothetical protein
MSRSSSPPIESSPLVPVVVRVNAMMLPRIDPPSPSKEFAMRVLARSPPARPAISPFMVRTVVVGSPNGDPSAS